MIKIRKSEAAFADFLYETFPSTRHLKTAEKPSPFTSNKAE